MLVKMNSEYVLQKARDIQDKYNYFHNYEIEKYIKKVIRILESLPYNNDHSNRFIDKNGDYDFMLEDRYVYLDLHDLHMFDFENTIKQERIK